MKKQIVSTLLALCMLLCLMPTAAFAEGSTETPPECSCETACTAESMNAECPVCGAEGALPENCEKCARPADDAAAQPETALMALIGGSETLTEVSTADELTAAVDSAVDTVKLTGDISISNSLTVKRTVTLDLNGHVLKYESANKGSVIVVEGGGQLTIEDSNTSKPSHRFNPNGKLWVLDEASGTETVTGGVITGGTGKPIQFGSGKYVYHAYYGGGVYIAPGGQLTMTGGNIVGCSAEFGGGICIESERDGKQGQFSMSGGNIIGCSAECGGGVYVDSESNQSPFSMSGGSIIGCVASDIGGGVRASGTFKMSGQAVIRSCTAESATQFVCGGGVYVNGSSSFEMSDTAIIEGCQAISTSSNSSNGGGVYVSSSSSFEMSDEAKIEGCQAISTSSNSSKGGGVHLANNTKFTLSGSAVIQNCPATNSANPGEAYGGGVSAACVKEITLADSARIAGCTAANGSGLYITGSLASPDAYGKLYANGGSVDGDVVLGDKDKNDGPCTITGSGGTVFNGKVTVTPGSTIESGTFNGEVINNGTISGGTFSGTVINGEDGTIAEGVSIPNLKFIVTFDNEGTKTQEIIDAGSKITEPTAPTKEGYRFDGWYYDNNGGKAKWNFGTDTVTRAMTLKAKWVQTYTVTFETSGGSAVGPVTVDAGSTVTKPADPTKSGYTFGGWYKDSTLQTPWDFANGTVTADTTLYAKWTANPPAPSYDDSDPTYAVSAPAAENGKIAVSPKNASAGSTVTITVKPDSGYVLETISATDRNGNDLKLTDRGNGKYTFTMPGSRVEVKVTFMEDNSVLNFFYDVPNGAYYYDAVKWAVDNGITGGVGNSLFAPNQPCTRGQIVTFLWRAAGSPVVNYAMNMTDVAEDAYYGEAVRWALSEGITTGIGDITFGPDAACTRAQAVAFLFRYAVASGMDAVTLADLISGFADAASVPGYAVSAMNWALSQGIMQGSGTQLLSGNTCTRAQIVTFLYRANQGK